MSMQTFIRSGSLSSFLIRPISSKRVPISVPWPDPFSSSSGTPYGLIKSRRSSRFWIKISKASS